MKRPIFFAICFVLILQSSVYAIGPATNVRVTLVSDTRVKVEWEFPNEPYWGARIRYRPVGSSEWMIHPNMSTYVKSTYTFIDDLTPGVTYEFQVLVYDESRTSYSTSGTVTATPGAPPEPDPPPPPPDPAPQPTGGPLRNFIDTIFDPIIRFLDWIQETLTRVGTVVAVGYDLNKWFGWIKLLGNGFVALLQSILASLIFLGFLYIIKTQSRFIIWLKEIFGRWT